MTQSRSDPFDWLNVVTTNLPRSVSGLGRCSSSETAIGTSVSARTTAPSGVFCRFRTLAASRYTFPAPKTAHARRVAAIHAPALSSHDGPVAT